MEIPFTGATQVDLKLNLKTKTMSSSTLYIIIMLAAFLSYNIFLNKSEGSSGYGIDAAGIVRTFISVILYLISWIVWFVIF
jgi:uncharacterized membrane protein